MDTLAPAYTEIIDFIASGTTPDTVISFKPSEAVKDRIATLIQQEKTDGLTSTEMAELNLYLQLEHMMRLAKARARQHLANE